MRRVSFFGSLHPPLSVRAARKWKIRKINGHVSKSDGCNFAPNIMECRPEKLHTLATFFSNLCANDVDPRAFLLVHTIKIIETSCVSKLTFIFIQNICVGKIAKNQIFFANKKLIILHIHVFMKNQTQINHIQKHLKLIIIAVPIAETS